MRFGKKITLLMLSLVATMGLCVSLIYGYMMNQQLERFHDDSVHLLSDTLADSLAGQIINNQSSQVLLVLNDLVKGHKEFEYAYVMDFEGRVFAHTFPKGFPAKLLELPDGMAGADVAVELDGKILRHYRIPIIEGMGATLYLGQNHDLQTALMYEVMTKMLLVIAAITILGIFIAQGSARRIARPVENIAEQLVNYIKGAEPGEIILRDDTYEIRRLVDAYNRLVHDRQTIQTALVNSEVRFEKLTRTSPVGVFQTDAEGRCQYVNPAWCDITGLTLSEALQDDWVSTLHPDDRERVFDEWMNAARQHTKFESEYRVLNKDKQAVWVYGQANTEYDSQGNVIGYSGTITDITEQKHHSLVLQEERNFIDTVLDTANALVVVQDRQGHIIRFNRACEETTLYDFAEVKDRYIWDILLADEQVEPAKGVFHDLINNALPGEVTNYWVAKDKSRRLIRWSNTVLKDDSGKVSHVISIGIDITEQHYVDNALRDALALNEEIVHSSPYGIAIYDQSGQCVMANNAIAQIVDATQEQVLAQNYNNLETWRKNGLLDIVKEVKKRQQRMRHEFELVTTSGRYAVHDCEFVPFYYQQQQHILLMVDDVTLRKQIEKRLLLTSRAVDDAITPIVMGNMDGGIIYANNAFVDMWGYEDIDEIVGRSARELWLPFSVEHEQEMMEVMLQNGKWSGEMRGLKKDGGALYVNVFTSAINDQDNQPIGLLASFNDISQEKAIKEELQRNQETLAKAQEIAHIGSWDWNIISGKMNWSDEIYRIFGWEPKDFPATYDGFLETIHPDDRQSVIDAVNASVEKAEQSYSIEHRVIRPGGGQRIVHEQGIVYRDHNGMALRMVGAVLDITEQKIAENEILNLNRELEDRVSVRTAELEESLKLLSRENEERKRIEHSLVEAKDEAERANQLKSEFLGRMSHELRTPMNAILGFSQLLETEGLNETQTDFVKEISLAGNHLLGLINEVLDLSRIESGKIELVLENCLLSDMVIDCINMVQPLAVEKNIQIDNRVEFSEHLMLQVDQLRFKEVLVNLLGNAVKYNSQDGNIIINTQMVGDMDIRLNVIDDGPGMTIKQQALMFEPFNRLGAEYSDIEGTGIGLTIAKKLVNLMKGRIGVQSNYGQGSTFWVEYPLITTDLMTKTTGTQQHNVVIAKPPSQQAVLYIEDNQANLRLVQNLFERLDKVVLYAAPNAELGIELAKAKRPDMILLDINLPGMNGYEALSRLRNLRETSTIPVIAISAAAMPRDIERGLAAGFKRYITKPIQVMDLLAAVKSELGQVEQPIASA